MVNLNYITAIIKFLFTIGFIFFTSQTSYTQCNGSISCTVCTNCSRCRYCNQEGGSCGACGSDSSYAGATENNFPEYSAKSESTSKNYADDRQIKQLPLLDTLNETSIVLDTVISDATIPILNDTFTNNIDTIEQGNIQLYQAQKSLDNGISSAGVILYASLFV